MPIADNVFGDAKDSVACPFGGLIPISHLFKDFGWEDVDLDALAYSHLRSAARYCRDVLTRPDPRQGRPGPICPYTPRATGRDLVALTYCRLKTADEEILVHGMADLRRVYLERDAELTEKDRVLHAVIITFPYLIEPDAGEFVQHLHARLKPAFTDHGLMIGEFYPDCPAPGLHNPDFRPLQAPVAAFVIRHMMMADVPFMVGDRRFLENYRHRFGEEGDRYLRDFLDRRPEFRMAATGNFGSADLGTRSCRAAR